MAVSIAVDHRQRFDWTCQSCMTAQSDTVAADTAINAVAVTCDLCNEYWELEIEPGVTYADIVTVRVVG